jgi:hypothetical protein
MKSGFCSGFAVRATQWARAARGDMAKHFCRVRVTNYDQDRRIFLSLLAARSKISIGRRF